MGLLLGSVDMIGMRVIISIGRYLVILSVSIEKRLIGGIAIEQEIEIEFRS